MAVAFASPIDLTGLELLNARIQNVAVLPAAGSEGRVVHLTADHKLYLDNGTSWIDLTAQGAVYTAGTGLTLTGSAFAADFGTGAGKVTQGNDSRLTNERVPTNGSVTDAKVATGANIAQSKIAGLVSDLAGKAPTVHTHAQGDVTGLATALTDAKNRANHTGSQAQSTVTNLVSDLAAKAPSANPTFTGTVTVPNGAVSGAAVNLGQLQAVQEGTKAKSARVVSVANVNVASPGASHGGKSLANGDIILLTAQSTASQNGPYRYNGASSALTRDPAADTWSELVGARWLIEEGTSKGTRWYSGAEAGGTIGTTALSIIPAPGVDDLIAGYGLTKTGNQLEVEFGDMDPLDLGGVSLMGTSLVGPDLIVAGAGNGVWFNPSAELVGVKNGTAADSAATVGQATSLAGRTIKGNVTAGLETTVTHNWGTRDVQVEVFRNSGNYDTVLCEVQRTSTNAVKLVFGTAASAGQYRYVIREIA